MERIAALKDIPPEEAFQTLCLQAYARLGRGEVAQARKSAEAAGALRGNGHEVVFHDLCAEGFAPVLPAAELPPGAPLPLDVRRHCDEAASAGGIVIIHPNWWGQPPAILKGWVDRVLRQGVAYAFGTDDSGEGVPVGLLKARAAVVFNTSNTPESREKTAFDDPRELLWRHGVFDLCGVRVFHRKMFSVVVTSTTRAASGLD